MSDCVSPDGVARSTTSASPACAGRSTGASSATDSCSAASSRSTSSSGIVASARGTSRVVQSTISGVGCTSTVAVKVHSGGEPVRKLVVGRRQLVVVLGPGDRPQARAREGHRVPAADVAVDRFRVDALLPDARYEDGKRHLPPPETGNLDALCEVVRRVLDRVLEVVWSHVDRHANAVLSQFLDRRSHAAIESET